MRNSRTVAVIGGVALLGSLAATSPALAGSDGEVPARARLTAELHSLNDSGVHGRAHARVAHKNIKRIAVRANGLSPAGPHAIHIHFGKQAANECPTSKQDADGNFRLNVVEGVPQYGPIAVSLTERGDTSAASALALDRMPVVADGQLRYVREDIKIGAVAGAAKDGGELQARKVARAIRDGKGVVVIHGNDYNSNGSYDLAPAGQSELAPVPAEATDPTACGVLEHTH